MPSLAQVQDELVDEYRRLTPTSYKMWKQYEHAVPDGPHRTEGVAPYPTYVSGSNGAELYDLDGRALTDFVCSNMGGILGHNVPEVRQRWNTQLTNGVFTLTPASELTLAEELASRIPSAEKVRFTPTGTEATMYALRLARAYTGRTKIAKADGSYHGSHDLVWIGQWRHHLQGEGLALGFPPPSPMTSWCCPSTTSTPCAGYS